MRCPFCGYHHDNEGDRFGCPNCEGIPRRGQPPKPPEKLASAQIHIRVTPAKKVELAAKAGAAGKTLSAWILAVLDAQ